MVTHYVEDYDGKRSGDAVDAVPAEVEASPVEGLEQEPAQVQAKVVSADAKKPAQTSDANVTTKAQG